MVLTVCNVDIIVFFGRENNQWHVCIKEWGEMQIDFYIFLQNIQHDKGEWQNIIMIIV